MAASGKQGEISFETNGVGIYKWHIITQKPFAEYKDAVNEAYQNGWLRGVVHQEWVDKRVVFEAWTGARGHAEWGDGRVEVQLEVYGYPAKWAERRIVYEVRHMAARACAYSRTAEIEAENRESLRLSALETYRQAYACEIEATILIARWQWVDEVTKVLAALTSSSSAVAGWLTWTNEGIPKNVWGALAGTASVLSIMHVALKVSDRVKDWSDTKGHFVRLRTELETLLYRMKVNSTSTLDEPGTKFEALRVRYGEGVDRRKVDPLAFGVRETAEAQATQHAEALRIRTQPIADMREVPTALVSAKPAR